MANIFIVTAEHFSVPGRALKAFATHGGAVNEAVSLVDIMWHDSGKKTRTTPANWEARIAALQDEHGAQFCYVDITEIKLED